MCLLLLSIDRGLFVVDTVVVVGVAVVVGAVVAIDNDVADTCFPY